MSQAWYNAIAKRNGGYKSDAKYTREGISGEVAFEALLKTLLSKKDRVLDMGCGHGDFTLKMASYCKEIIGGDNAEALLEIAQKLKAESRLDNVSFRYAWTKGAFPFEDDQFDLIYTRRGPTSIANHPRILKKGGRLVGIHSFDLNPTDMIEKLDANGFQVIEFTAYDQAYYLYESVQDFAKHVAAMHMQKDYTLPEHAEALKDLVEANMRDGRLSWPEHRYVWQAIRK